MVTVNVHLSPSQPFTHFLTSIGKTRLPTCDAYKILPFFNVMYGRKIRSYPSGTGGYVVFLDIRISPYSARTPDHQRPGLDDTTLTS